MKKYTCKKCGDEWEFIPEDYDYKKELYPTTCPFCEMPVRQMVRDLFVKKEYLEIIKRLFLRLKP